MAEPVVSRGACLPDADLFRIRSHTRLVSGHRCPVLELRSPPSTGHENVAKGFGRIPDIDMPDIERAEAKANQVGSAKIPNDPARDQCLHHRVALLVRE